jgi:DNA-binding PadR family transcriptional regulator
MRETSPRPESLLPLSEVVWEVLLALAAEDRHGYAILLDVERRTDGRLALLPGTLYRALHRLQAEGLVAEASASPPAGDSRRRVFRLTALGRRTAMAEARRLAAGVSTARALGLLPEEPR